MTLDEMFDEINKSIEETFIFHDTYIVQLEVKYTYLEKPEVFTTILWHEVGYESCITEFMPKNFSWYDDWYHCCKKENVKVLNYSPIEYVFDVGIKCANCKHASIHCAEYDTDVDALDSCSNWESVKE